MRRSGTRGFTLPTKSYLESDFIEASDHFTGRLRATLVKADERVATLESELARVRATLRLLLADDLRTCEELAELQEMIWGYHRGLPGSCE